MSTPGAQTGRKKVLMFCAKFFGYENRIADALRDSGYEVDLYDERPSNSFICKATLRLNMGIYRPVTYRRVKRIIEENRGKNYDYVFVVKSEAMGEKEVALLREAYPRAKFILYFWDSVDNVPEGEKKMALYDRVLSFDPVDAEKYHIPFLPIPYGKEHQSGEAIDHYEYDVAFIGTAHSVRPRVVKQLKACCERDGKRCYTYFYSPHILVYLMNKLTNPDYRYLSLKEVHFTPLSSEEVCRIYSLSRCVMDIEHPKQHGTTTRPVEMLPMHKKIITTNQFVRDFSFYNENNFCIVDRDKPEFDTAFCDTPYIPADEETMRFYSPEHFVQSLIGET